MTPIDNPDASVSVQKTKTDRLKDRLKSKIGSESGRSFAQRAGLPASTVQSVLNGSKPTVDVLVALSETAKVSISWLATGEDHEGPVAGEFLGVPRYDATLAAGSGAFNERAKLIDYIPFTKEFMANKLGRTSTDGLVVLETRGDSMEPTINGGDLVLIDQKSKEITDGIIAFVLDGTAFVKRIRKTPVGIEFLSDNRIYTPYYLDKASLDDFHIIGRVRWIGKTVGN